MVPAEALAQTSVVVLGIRSVEGDDEFARNLTGALRHAASRVEGWAVSDREVTLAQMALAFGCEQPDSDCMGQIAESLDAQRVIYGEVRRSSAGQSYDFSMNLHVFNAQIGEVEHSVTDTIPSVRQDIDDLREPVRRYVAALTGAPRVGTLRISVNVPGAEVFIDDEPAGVADADGELVVQEVPAGSRHVRVVAPGHQSFRSTVAVEAHGEATFEAELETSAGGGGGGVSGEIVAGVTLVVTAAALAAAWIASWVHVHYGLEEDEDFQQYRLDVSQYVRTQMPGADPTQANVCTYAQDSRPDVRDLVREEMGVTRRSDVGTEARDVCSQADVFEALEFAFGITAGVAAGLGIYFLASGLSSSGSAQPQSWRLEPSIGPDHAYLNLRVRF